MTTYEDAMLALARLLDDVLPLARDLLRGLAEPANVRLVAGSAGG